MGLYAGGLDPRGLNIAAIAATMRPVLADWFNGEVAFRNPRTDTATEYDPLEDTGGDAEPVALFTARALIQPIRNTAVADYGDQAVSLAAVRLQLHIPEDQQLRSGMIARVVDGGEDAQLLGEDLLIDSVLSSSLAWYSIVQARTVAR